MIKKIKYVIGNIIYLLFIPLSIFLILIVELMNNIDNFYKKNFKYNYDN
jgi:diacylglycerol kinase